MGLGSTDFNEAKKRGESKSGSSNSSSSSGGSSGFPKTRKRCPQVVLLEDNGEYELVKYPETEPLTWEKTWHSQPWKLAEEPPLNWDMIWWSDQEYTLDKLKVQEVVGADYEEILKNNPEKAKQVLSDAKAGYESDSNIKEALKVRSCAVCDEDIHLLHDDHQEISNKVVCSSHSVEEVAGQDLL